MYSIHTAYNSYFPFIRIVLWPRRRAWISDLISIRASHTYPNPWEFNLSASVAITREMPYTAESGCALTLVKCKLPERNVDHSNACLRRDTFIAVEIQSSLSVQTCLYVTRLQKLSLVHFRSRWPGVPHGRTPGIHITAAELDSGNAACIKPLFSSHVVDMHPDSASSAPASDSADSRGTYCGSASSSRESSSRNGSNVDDDIDTGLGTISMGEYSGGTSSTARGKRLGFGVGLGSTAVQSLVAMLMTPMMQLWSLL